MGAALVSPCVSPPESITMPPPSGVNNIFALLDDDNENEDDGFTVVAKPVKPPAKAAKAKRKNPSVRFASRKTIVRHVGRATSVVMTVPTMALTSPKSLLKTRAAKVAKVNDVKVAKENAREERVVVVNSIATVALAVGRVLHAKAVDRTTGVTRQMVFLKVLQKELLRLMERTRPHPPLRKRKRKRTP